MGIQASVVTDVDGKERLMLRSKDSGTGNSFTVGIDPALTKLGQTNSQLAQNAVVKLNGVTVESNSNTFANTIPGMSFSVSEITTNSATMTVKTDTEAIKKSLQEFVDAYNELNDLLSKSTVYTAETKTAGVLQGDSATVSLQNTLRMLTQGISGSTGAFTRLSDIGIQMRQGGGLTVDSTKLDKGLANVDGLKALFANKVNSMGQGGGIAVNFKAVTDKLLAFDGTLNSKTDSLERTLKSNGAEQDKVNKRATTLEERLYKQYSALDGKMSSLNALNSYVSQMVTTWNKSSS
jgi:flagellar hook-associated protein 2